MWRSHNKERNIDSNDEKALYLNLLNKELKRKNQSNNLNAYSLMSNHTHEVYDINNKKKFSDLMRNHHSRYGQLFNINHQRSGKVAYDRPKTCLIESEHYSMNATFYIHANPVKAGITKNAANYRWSTHRLYAFGKRDRFSINVKFPDWYMALGKNFQERQKNYRKLFDAYLQEQGLIDLNFLDKYSYGSPLWMMKITRRISLWRKENRLKDPP